MVERSSRPIEERFWSKVAIAGSNECWLWTGATNGKYGVIAGGRRGAPRRFAHRLSYELHHGPIPSDAFVCHRCDTRLCVNPAHLFLGTAAENQADMVRKGRSLRGERHNRVVLSEADVLAIREAFATTSRLIHELAAQYGVSKSAISAIIRGESWKHLLPSDWTPPSRGKWFRR